MAGEGTPTGKKPSSGKKQWRPKKPLPAPGPDGVVLLSGGNPQIAKGGGEGPVQAYIAAMPGWKRPIGQRIDAIITAIVPDVQKAVKWNTPLYGRPGEGWFTSMHCFDTYVKVTFFRGAALDPIPPGPSRQKDVRYLDIREGDDFEAGFTRWIEQASRLPGEKL